MKGGSPETPGNGVVVGMRSTRKRFWISPFSIFLRTNLPSTLGKGK